MLDMILVADQQADAGLAGGKAIGAQVAASRPAPSPAHPVRPGHRDARRTGPTEKVSTERHYGLVFERRRQGARLGGTAVVM
jgi:hypothetical protein